MKNTDSEWCVLTFAKNEFPFLESFVNYYSQFWGISKFVLLIGWTEQGFLDSFLERCRGVFEPILRADAVAASPDTSMHQPVWHEGAESGEKPSCSLLSYRTEIHTPQEHIYAMKTTGALELNARLPAHYHRVFAVDNDEYYYSSNLERSKQKGYEDFHFVDFVPLQTFSLQDEWRWCVQPWYYSSVMIPLQHELGKHSFFCPWCKRLHFDRRFISAPAFEFATIHDHCRELHGLGETCRNLNQSAFDPEALLQGSICYHLSVPDKHHLEKYKIQQGFVRFKGKTNYDRYEEFEKCFAKTHYPVFASDFLKQYWKN